MIGTVFAVNGIFSVILKPIYGYILDKIGMSKYLLYFVVLMSALMAPFFIYVYQPLLMSNTLVGIIVGAIYLSFASVCGRGGVRILYRPLQPLKRHGVWADPHVGLAGLGGGVILLWLAV